MKKKFVVIGLCSLLCLTGCGKTIPKLENGEEVVAEINDKKFTTTELYEKLKDEGGYSVLMNMIDKHIISVEFTDEEGAKAYANTQYTYLKNQYTANNQDLDEMIKSSAYGSVQNFKDDIMEDYKRTKVAEKYIIDNLTEDEINKYYKDEIFGTMTVKHILIIPKYESGATEDVISKAKTDALNKAKDLIKQIKEGADFEKLAKENSDDTATAVNGGLFENFSKETTDAAFWAASYKLSNDTYTTTPVESAYGYHIIYKVSSKEKPTLEESKNKINSAIANTKLNSSATAIDSYWVKIREKYNLNIIDSNIETKYNDTKKDL